MLLENGYAMGVDFSGVGSTFLLLLTTACTVLFYNPRWSLFLSVPKGFADHLWLWLYNMQGTSTKIVVASVYERLLWLLNTCAPCFWLKYCLTSTSPSQKHNHWTIPHRATWSHREQLEVTESNTNTREEILFNNTFEPFDIEAWLTIDRPEIQ
jgi:hypothetical protein